MMDADRFKGNCWSINKAKLLLGEIRRLSLFI